MRFFSELRRRNVLRMAAFYLAAAWLVMQVEDVLEGPLSLPDWTGSAVLAVLAVGFPIAVIVSWFWDITPEGIVRDTELPELRPPLAASGRRIDFVIIAMLAAAVILLLFWKPPASGDDAMTVLPFESVTGPEEKPFSEGISIELLNLLAQLRKIKMKQPPAAAILAGFSDVPTLAREMNVRWVLKGSVRRAEQRVRVSVQLLDAEDDAAIVWSNVFDRELSAANLFAIQSEIARLVTSEVGRTLDEPAEQRLAAPPTQNTEAYSAYLLGRQRLTDRRVDWLEDAVDQFALAVELDTNFAGAYAGLVDACLLYKDFSGGQQHERCPAAPEALLQLAQKAIELDPELGEAWISLGRSLEEKFIAEGVDQWLEIVDEAESYYERGLELNPNQSQGYLWHADNLGRLLRYREPGSFWNAWGDRVWQSVIAKGLEVDPLSIPLHYEASDYPFVAQTPEEAMWHARRIVEIAPDSPMGLYRLGQYTWSLEGRVDEAIRWFHRGAQVDPDQIRFVVMSAYAYSALGDFDMALAYLDKRDRLVAQERRESHSALLRRGMVYLHAGRMEEAVEVLERLQDDVPRFGMSYQLRALTSLDLAAGDYDKALARYEPHRDRCLEEKKVLQDVWNCPVLEFARTLEATGDIATAVQLMDGLYEVGSDERDATQVDVPEDLMLIGNWSRVFEDFGGIVARNEQDKWLEHLERAVKMGFRGTAGVVGDWRFFAYHDITVDYTRDHPRFQAAVAVIEADMAQQLENVRAMQQRGELPTLAELRAELTSE